MFKCYLCPRAGRPSGTRYGRGGSSLICRDCAAMLTSQDRKWCNYGKHVVALERFDVNHAACRTCRAAMAQRKQGHTPPPADYVLLSELAVLLRTPRDTVYGWLRRGWDVPIHRVGRHTYVKRMAAYPLPPNTRRKETT